MSTIAEGFIDRMNYANDARTQGPPPKPVLYLDDGTELELPTCWAVCGVCGGDGKHVNPSIDAGGISADDFCEDPDFADDYMSGAFDVSCNSCNGRTTVKVVDWNSLTEEQAEAYQSQLDDDASYEAERRAEFIMGC